LKLLKLQQFRHRWWQQESYSVAHNRQPRWYRICL
jgi:hypothetical protein